MSLVFSKTICSLEFWQLLSVARPDQMLILVAHCFHRIVIAQLLFLFVTSESLAHVITTTNV